MRRFAARDLFEQWTTRFLKCRRCNHYVWIGIGRARIVDALHFRSDCRVFRLRSGNVYRRSNFNQRKKFWRGFAMQSNAAMRSWNRMDKALVKSIGGGKLTPIAHRIANVVSRSATRRWDDTIALHAKSVRAGTLLLLLGIDGEATAGRWLSRNAYGTGHRHKATITFHDVNVLFFERNFHPHRRGIVRLVSGYVICPAREDSPSCTTREKQNYSGTSRQC